MASLPPTELHPQLQDVELLLPSRFKVRLKSVVRVGMQTLVLKPPSLCTGASWLLSMTEKRHAGSDGLCSVSKNEGLLYPFKVFSSLWLNLFDLSCLAASFQPWGRWCLVQKVMDVLSFIASLQSGPLCPALSLSFPFSLSFTFQRIIAFCHKSVSSISAQLTLELPSIPCPLLLHRQPLHFFSGPHVGSASKMFLLRRIHHGGTELSRKRSGLSEIFYY